jgi:hypothetical protein
MSSGEYQALIRLRSLFEVGEDEDTSKLIGELFLFTQEIKSFLKQVKMNLRIKDNITLTELLELIAKRLRSS